MRGRWFAPVIVFTVATGVSSAWAAPPDTPVALAGGTAARTLSFDTRNDKGLTAQVTLVVKLPRTEIEDRTAQSRISFLPLGAGSTGERVLVDGEPAGAYPSDAPALFTADGEHPRLHSGQNLVRLTFGLADDAALTVADGLLRVRLPDRELVGVDVETKATSPKLTFEPSTVKLQVTNGLPLFGAPKLADPTGTSEAVALSGPRAASAVAGDDVEGTLHAANDDTAKATLALSEEIDGGGTVTVRDWSGTESFSGNLVLDPHSATPTTLAVELNVRDSIWLPVGAVFLGAVLGNLLLPRYRQWRRQRILKSALEDAIAAYEEQDPEGQDFFFNLDLVLGPKGSRTLVAGACVGRPVGRVPLIALLCDIDSAKTETDFQEVTARTQALLAEITQWHEFRHAIVSLVAAYARADPPAGMLLEHDVEHALFDVQSPPPKATTQAALERLRGQAQLVDAYALLKWRIAALRADPETSDGSPGQAAGVRARPAVCPRPGARRRLDAAEAGRHRRGLADSQHLRRRQARTRRARKRARRATGSPADRECTAGTHCGATTGVGDPRGRRR